MMNINTFDQPAVEQDKRLARSVLGALGLEEEKQELGQLMIFPESSEEF